MQATTLTTTLAYSKHLISASFYAPPGQTPADDDGNDEVKVEAEDESEKDEKEEK